MDDNRKIIFISSYPKSGNTWLRCLIGALLNNKNVNFSIENELKIPMKHLGYLK